MNGVSAVAYGRILQPQDVRGHVVAYTPAYTVATGSMQLTPSIATAPIQLAPGIVTPRGSTWSSQHPNFQPTPRATTPRRQARQTVSPAPIDETPHQTKELPVASPRLGVRRLRSVNTPSRTPRRDLTPPRGSPCGTPPVPRGTIPSRGSTHSPIVGGPISANSVAGTDRAVSSTCGSVSDSVSKVIAPVTVHRGAGSQHVPIAQPRPPPAPVMRFSTYPGHASKETSKAKQSDPPIRTKEDEPKSEAKQSDPTAFDRLYDEDWWYWHLEDRRRGGAPPDAFIRCDEPEILTGRDKEGRKLRSDDTDFTPRKGSARIRVPATGFAGADIAAGGVRQLEEKRQFEDKFD